MASFRRPYIFEENASFSFDFPFITTDDDVPANVICSNALEFVKKIDDCFVLSLQRNVTTLAGGIVCNIATDTVVHNG